jgi:uncharacterized protein (TIGR00255 family)
MIRSMTGYGQASTDLGEARVTVELRTLNHRYADLRLRLPSDLAATERAIRRTILQRIKRGRVELTVNVESIEGGNARPQLNRPLLDEVLATCKTLQEELQIDGTPDVRTVLGVQGMFRSAAVVPAWDDGDREALDRCLGQALDALDAERLREGRHLQEDLSERLKRMSQIVTSVRERAGKLPDILRDRLVERLNGLAGDLALDPTRVAQEAVLLAERGDVTEELVRLDGHLAQAADLIDRPDGKPVGKALDFLVQEIQRETNTLNSKSADLELGQMALGLKGEVEKVREQVQNLE